MKTMIRTLGNDSMAHSDAHSGPENELPANDAARRAAGEKCGVKVKS